MFAHVRFMLASRNRRNDYTTDNRNLIFYNHCNNNDGVCSTSGSVSRANLTRNSPGYIRHEVEQRGKAYCTLTIMVAKKTFNADSVRTGKSNRCRFLGVQLHTTDSHNQPLRLNRVAGRGKNEKIIF